jgi:hypothetical protein
MGVPWTVVPVLRDEIIGLIRFVGATESLPVNCPSPQPLLSVITSSSHPVFRLLNDDREAFSSVPSPLYTRAFW